MYCCFRLKMEQVQTFLFLCIVCASGVGMGPLLHSEFLGTFYYLHCKQKEVQINGVPCSREALKLMRCFCPFLLTLKKLALGFWSRENRWKCRHCTNCRLTLGSSYCGKTNLSRLEKESSPFPDEMQGSRGGECTV